MLTTAGSNSVLSAWSATHASLHSSFPGNTGAGEIAGVVRAPLTWLTPADGTRRTANSPVWTLADGGSPAWIGLWTASSGGACVAAIPWGGAERPYRISNNRVVWTAHGLIAGRTVVFVNGAPLGATEGQVYFVVNPDQDSFQVAATLGGAPLGIQFANNDPGLALISPIVVNAVGPNTSVSVAGIQLAIDRLVTINPPAASIPSSIVSAQGATTTLSSFWAVPDGANIIDYELTQGTLPAGATLVRTTGEITTTASANGSANNLQVTATDSRGVKGVSAPFSFAVNAKPVWNSNPQTVVQGASINLNSLCSDTDTRVYAAATSLPAGVTLSGSTLSFGSNVAPGNYTITLSASDGINPPVLQTITFTVTAPPVVSTTISATLALDAKLDTVFPWKAGVHWNRYYVHKDGAIIGYADGNHGWLSGASNSVYTPSELQGGATSDSMFSIRLYNDTPVTITGIAPSQTGYAWGPRDRFRDLGNYGGGPIPPVPGSYPAITGNFYCAPNAPGKPVNYIGYAVRSPISGGDVVIWRGTASNKISILDTIPAGTPAAPNSVAGNSQGSEFYPNSTAPDLSYKAIPSPDWTECPEGVYVEFQGGATGAVKIIVSVSHAPFALVGDYDNYHPCYFPSEDYFYWVPATSNAGSITDDANGIFNFSTGQWVYGSAATGGPFGRFWAAGQKWTDYIRIHYFGTAIPKNSPNTVSESLDTFIALRRDSLYIMENNPDSVVDGKPRRVREMSTPLAAYPWAMQLSDNFGGADWTNGYMNAACSLGEWFVFMLPQTLATRNSFNPANGATAADAPMYKIRINNPLQWEFLGFHPNYYSPPGSQQSDSPLFVGYEPGHAVISVWDRLRMLDLDAKQWIDISPANWPAGGILDAVGGIKKSRTVPGGWDLVVMGRLPARSGSRRYFHRITLTGEKPQASYYLTSIDKTYPGTIGPSPWTGKHYRFLHAATWRDRATGQLVNAGATGGFVWQFGGDYRGVPGDNVSNVPGYPIPLSGTSSDGTPVTSPRLVIGPTTFYGWKVSGSQTTTLPIEIRNAGSSGVGPVIATIPAGTAPGTEVRLLPSQAIACSAGIYVAHQGVGSIHIWWTGNWNQQSGRQDQWRAPVNPVNGRIQLEMSCNHVAFYPYTGQDVSGVELGPPHPDGVGLFQDKNGWIWCGPGYFRFAIPTSPRSARESDGIGMFRFGLPGLHTDGIRKGDAWDRPEQGYLIPSAINVGGNIVPNPDYRPGIDTDLGAQGALGLSTHGGSNVWATYDRKEHAAMMFCYAGRDSLVNFKFHLTTEFPFTATQSSSRINRVDHGLISGHKIRFVNGNPPAPLVAGTVYEVMNATKDNFQVKQVGGSTAIALTSSVVGAGCVVQQTHDGLTPYRWTRQVIARDRQQFFGFLNPLRRRLGGRSFTISTSASTITLNGTMYWTEGAIVYFDITNPPAPFIRKRRYVLRNVTGNTFQLSEEGSTTPITIPATRLHNGSSTANFVDSACRLIFVTGRAFATVNAGKVGLSNHGWVNGDIIRFEVAAPTPLVVGQDYQVINRATLDFGVAEVGSSDQITLTGTMPTGARIQGPTVDGFHDSLSFPGTFYTGSQEVINDHAYVYNQLGGAGGYSDRAISFITKINIRTNQVVKHIALPTGHVSLYDMLPTRRRVTVVSVTQVGSRYRVNFAESWFTMDSAKWDLEQDKDGQTQRWNGYSDSSGVGSKINGGMLILSSAAGVPATGEAWVTVQGVPGSINEFREMKAVGHKLVLGPPQVDYDLGTPLVYVYDTNRDEWTASKSWNQMRADAVDASGFDKKTGALWPLDTDFEKGAFAAVPEKQSGCVWVIESISSPSGIYEVRV